MKPIYYLALLFSAFPMGLWAQANDECIDAIAVPADQLDYCSGAAAFSSVSATRSLEVNEYPACLTDTENHSDVWFSFVAQRNAANIRVTGDVAGDSRGSLQRPQFALFRGGCTTPEQVICGTAAVLPGNIILNGVNGTATDLVRGETYFISVGADAGNTGTFELCLNQFDAVPAPSGDCATGVVLCDKSSFSVDFLQGFGNTREDLLAEQAGCEDNPAARTSPPESNSAWYKWTCEQSGSLGFVITPLGASVDEDLDFAVYELTNGIDDCGSRQILRQMFSGQSSDNINENLPCLGQTGLSDVDPDFVERCGCQPGNNNFAQSIDMVAGRSYALVVMNFSGTDDGFSIEFTGEGTFEGPDANFNFDVQNACVGETVTFQDNSTSLDGIAGHDWNFGPSATPQTATGPGPHQVTFNDAGNPAVSLVITTNRDCEEFVSSQEVTIECCSDQFDGSETITDVQCPNDGSGAISFTGSSSFAPGTETYLWSTGATTPDISGLNAGNYSLTFSDQSSCERIFDFVVSGPADLVLDTLITESDCGTATGSVTVDVVSGGTPPFEFSFDGGAFGPSNRLDNAAAGPIAVTLRDANGCTVDLDLEVPELNLRQAAGQPAFTEPSCNGEADATLTINLENGAPPFQYDFGSGPQADNTQTGLTAGTYSVDVVDANGCTGQFTVTIPEPPLLTLELQQQPISCFGEADGSLNAIAGGGQPNYTFAWSDGNTASERTDLGPGTYTVSLTDAGGCVLEETATITDPGEIVMNIVDQAELACFGDPAGSFTLGVTGGTAPYGFSTNGVDFQPQEILGGLAAGDYVLTVRDANGCEDTVEGSLTQPEELILASGPGGEIFLGFDTVLNVTSNQNPVTYSWSPETIECLNADCSSVRATPNDNTVYTIVGTNMDGCIDSTTVELNVILELPVFTPNAISPNGDGANDNFTIFGGPALEQINVLRVYNRWGGLVFENQAPLPPNEPSAGWDGTSNGEPVSSGVFIFYAELQYINGNIEGVSGDITVLR